MALIMIDFGTLKQHHHRSSQIGGYVNGPVKASIVDKGLETCCVQISYALNNAGASIGKYNFWNAEMGRNVRAVPDTVGRNYIFEVSDMKVYLNAVHGSAENYKGTKQSMIDKIRGRHGLLGFGHRHIDLWEGERWHLQDYYLDLWTFDSVKQRGIFFWEVKSEDEILQDRI